NDGDTNHFTWNVSDGGAGLGSMSITIRRDGAIIYQTTDLANAVGDFNFDSYGLGTYTIDVTATDADTDRPLDSLTTTQGRIDVVNDDDVLAPTILLGGPQPRR